MQLLVHHQSLRRSEVKRFVLLLACSPSDWPQVSLSLNNTDHIFAEIRNLSIEALGIYLQVRSLVSITLSDCQSDSMARKKQWLSVNSILISGFRSLVSTFSSICVGTTKMLPSLKFTTLSKKFLSLLRNTNPWIRFRLPPPSSILHIYIHSTSTLQNFWRRQLTVLSSASSGKQSVGSLKVILSLMSSKKWSSLIVNGWFVFFIYQTLIFARCQNSAV